MRENWQQKRKHERDKSAKRVKSYERREKKKKAIVKKGKR
jgi:hypothetical protein